MRSRYKVLFSFLVLIYFVSYPYAQVENTDEIKNMEKLINTLVKERRNWDDAARSLIEIGEPAVAPLLEVIKNISLGEWPRRKAVMVLGNIRSEKAISPLSEVFNNKNTENAIRNSALIAIGKTGSERTIDFLIKASEDENDWFRVNAISALGKFRSDRTINVVVKAMNDDFNYVRISVLNVLSENNIKKYTGLFIETLKDPDWMVRQKASEILLKCGKTVIDPLVKLLDENNYITRWETVRIFGKIKSENTVESLIKMLDDRKWMVRNEAAVALSRIKSEKTEDLLIKALGNKSVYVREEAAWILGEFGSHKAVELLNNILINSKSKVRKTIIQALGKIKNSNINRNSDVSGNYGEWMNKPQSEWPQITMINNIEYSNKSYPVAGCSFLLDTGKDIIAATAKHILTYFKSDKMKFVSFENSLKNWKMFPKNNKNDVVIIEKLINEEKKESIKRIPPDKDWILFTIKRRSENIQPLRLRTDPVKPGEKIYIIGWKYNDNNCSQRIFEGNFVKYLGGTVITSTKVLADNKIPGLSGSPVIDSKGYVIGLMSQKYGKMERLSSIEYPKRILKSLK